MSPAEMIAVIQAHADGKTIEGRNKPAREGDAWIVVSHVDLQGFDFIKWEYRVQPEPKEPRVIYVNEYPNGCLRTNNYINRETAVIDAKGGPTRKFIEVLE